jgi:hypothetical protein
MKWAKSEGDVINDAVYARAGVAGSLETVRWLVEEGGWKEEVVQGATLGGHWDVLLWAKEQGLLSPSEEASEHTAACANNGNLEILKWLKTEGYPMNWKYAVSACSGGHVHLLEWLISENPDVTASYTFHHLLRGCYMASITGNHQATLFWISSNLGVPRSFSDEKKIWDCAARNGNLETLNYLWAVFGGFLNFGKKSQRCVMSRGDLKILDWLCKHGCVLLEAEICGIAVESRNLDLLKWARDRDCPWDEYVCMKAAETGNLEILKWAREHGCPWDKFVCIKAAETGNLEILKWARENECPWCDDLCLISSGTGNLEVLKWVREHGSPWEKNAILAAVLGNHVDCLNWAYRNGCPYSSFEIVWMAITKGKVDVLDWAIENMTFTGDTEEIFGTTAVTPELKNFAGIQRFFKFRPSIFLIGIISSGNVQSLIWALKKIARERGVTELDSVFHELEEYFQDLSLQTWTVSAGHLLLRFERGEFGWNPDCFKLQFTINP